MKLRHLMTVSALLACPYGIVMIFAPTFVLTSAGLDVTGDGLLLARMYGAEVFGVGLISFVARTAADSPARRAILIGFIVLDVLSMSMAVFGQLNGHGNPTGWLEAVTFFLFAAGYTFFLLNPSKAD